MEEFFTRAASFLVPILPGLILGFVLGIVAKKALSTALTLAGVVILAVFVVAYFGAEVAVIADWLRGASAWAGDRMSETRQYLAALVPTLAGLGVGFKLGLGRG